MSEPTLKLDAGDAVIKYIGGSQPYYWIGKESGAFVGAVSAATLKAFVTAPLKWDERQEAV